MNLGTLIKKWRLERGLTLEAVALEAGTDQGNLSRIERDAQQPSAILLSKIANALGLTVSTLYAELEEGRSGGVRGATPQYSKQLQQIQKGFLALSSENQQLAIDFIKLLGKRQRRD